MLSFQRNSASRFSQGLFPALGWTALACCAWLAIGVQNSDRDPEGFHGSWVLGPRPEALERQAEQHARKGLAALGDPTLPGDERVARYEEELSLAEELLTRNLKAEPGRARALARLAAVRWERDSDPSEQRIAERMALIRAAADRAPASPAVHFELGQLLLHMERGESLEYFSRAVELEPATARSVVAILRANFLSAREILEALPRDPRVLVALASLFFEDGEHETLLRVMEQELDSKVAPAMLVEAYGDACVRAKDSERLLRRLDRLGTLTDAQAEAERLRARSRAYLLQDETARAIEDARSARDLRPEEPELANYLGYVLASAGQADSAIRTYQEVLGLLARRKAAPGSRAAIYSRIGRTEEQRQRVDRAYDAYKMALRLDPDESWAKERVEQMTRAASLR